MLVRYDSQKRCVNETTMLAGPGRSVGGWASVFLSGTSVGHDM